jgi:outer membrane immunogenic protein
MSLFCSPVLHFGDQILQRADYSTFSICAAAGGNSRRFSLKQNEQEPESAMKKLLQGAVGLVALAMAVPAVAADLPARTYSKAPAMVAAVYDWSGFYVGLNGGWGSSRNCWDRNTGLGGTFLAAEGCNNATGGVAGGQIGYRWQSSAWVFGIEAQGDWANLRGTNLSLIVPGGAFGNIAVLAAGTGPNNQSQMNAFGLFTGQVGYAFNTALLYAKGGAAVVANKYNGYNALTGASIDSATDTRWGGTVGAGVEYAFAPNWSAALEYDHLFMGSRTLDFTSTVVPGAFTREEVIRQNVDLVTVRINYRWGGPVIAKY